MQDNKDTKKISITLQENGIHSLWKGIEAFAAYNQSQDKMLIKDAIMFLHHGVELLMKQILTRNSPFLIFEDLRDAANKQKQADKAGVDIFFLTKPPRTVSFEEALNRVDAFIKPQDLDDTLRENLNQLNQLRNRIEHHEIEVDQEKVNQLLDALHQPLLDLFDNQLGGIKRLQTPRVKDSWRIIHERAKFHSELEEEVAKVLKLSQDRIIPGEFLNSDRDITIPSFSRITKNPVIQTGTENVRFEIDILAESEADNWIVDVKGRLNQKNWRNSIGYLMSISYLTNATAWMIVLDEIREDARKIARQYNVLLTDKMDWQKLKNFIQTQPSN